MKKQSLTRRTPRQARARETVSFIFEAAVRILEADGLDALTTNRIAALAGVSIGTLYQYFPNREALLEALARREIASVFESLARLRQADAPATSRDERLRQIVRALLGALDGRLRARRALMMAIMSSGRFEAVLAQTDSMTAALVARAGPVSEADALNGFVLSRAVGGAVRGALLRDETILREPAFEEALLRLIAGFLGQGGVQP